MWGNLQEILSRSGVKRDDELDAVQFARQRLGFEPEPLQARVLESRHSRGILNCSRQWGKSSVAAVKAIHKAVSLPGTTVLVASPSNRQSAEFLDKAQKLMRRAGMPVRGDGKNDVSLAFGNGSRIVGLPGVEATVRGFSSISLLLIDEAAWVEDAMYHALRPMLAVGRGDLWLMSTPCYQRGFFYETWENGGPEWFRVKAPATECTRISEEFLAEELEELGEDKFRREYLCEFMDSGTEVFGREAIENAFVDLVRPLEL
jgi:hypothetical protein